MRPVAGGESAAGSARVSAGRATAQPEGRTTAMPAFTATDLEGVGGVLLQGISRCAALLQPIELRPGCPVAGQADGVPIAPGRERLDAHTLAYRAENVIDTPRGI